ncbi:MULTISPECIES: hypothetical protein [Bacillaceae]|uniref:Uncharacterized protein n=1 Tax=Evansella alkalicola TaxID=745819 RepID=A0ABS6JSY3_9BACI|nr:MULTISPECIES: hypothetical protein [Bacillaceae]MBU9721669.1 hypothetical protein [Bacillus alkalicola]
MKIKALLGLALSALIFAACSVDEPEADAAEEAAGEDAVSGATQVIVTDEDSFFNGVSENGAWIIIFNDDLTVDEDIVLAGVHTHRDEPARKLALYEQDADRNVTERFTLTAPSLTVQSPNTRIQGGTFAGDVLVEAEGFSVVNATVEGNVYFASQELMDSAEIGEDGEVTGAWEVNEDKATVADAVTGATQVVVTDEDSFLQGISENGAWIVIFNDDLTVDEDVVLAGVHTHRDEPARKLALYEQDADRNVTARFTLNVPSLTVQSPNTRIQGGTVAGDVFVEAEGFSVVNATVDGNVYFASQELLDAAEIGEDGEVTGAWEVQ